MTRHGKASLDVVRDLDPVADYQAIYDRLLFVDAASTMAAGLNLAFYRSFAAPNIATLLASTRVAIDEPVQRAECGLPPACAIHHPDWPRQSGWPYGPRAGLHGGATRTRPTVSRPA